MVVVEVFTLSSIETFLLRAANDHLLICDLVVEEVSTPVTGALPCGEAFTSEAVECASDLFNRRGT